MQHPPVVDEAKLEEFRSGLAQRRRSLPRWLAVSILRPFLVGLILFLVLLPLLDGRLPALADLRGRRLLVGPLAAGLLALLSTAMGYRQLRDTLQLSAAEHRRMLEQEWASWVGPHWLGRVVRIGLLLTLGVGVPVGLLLAVTLAPAELPAGSRPLMLLSFVGLTALWAFTFAFLIRWLALHEYRGLGRES